MLFVVTVVAIVGVYRIDIADDTGNIPYSGFGINTYATFMFVEIPSVSQPFPFGSFGVFNNGAA